MSCPFLGISTIDIEFLSNLNSLVSHTKVRQLYGLCVELIEMVSHNSVISWTKTKEQD